MTILIGNDVEFILVSGNSPKSAIGIVGGSKDSPSPCKCGALQEDNVLAEINIDPARTAAQWETNISAVVEELRARLPDNVFISKFASALFPAGELMHPKAKEFGCDPDINAWTESTNNFTKPKGTLSRLRSAGGHVHIGIPELSVEDGFEVIRCLDAFIGIQTVLHDSDVQRKVLYGKAGAMRFKSYGVEWRTPSNFWAHSAATRKWMFESAMFIAKNFKSLQKYYITHNVTEAINSNDKGAASRLLGEFIKHVPLPKYPQ